jgi:hypothetical protein
VAPPDDRAFIVITKAARVVKGLPVESSIRSFVCAVVLWLDMTCQRLAQRAGSAGDHRGRAAGV